MGEAGIANMRRVAPVSKQLPGFLEVLSEAAGHVRDSISHARVEELEEGMSHGEIVGDST